MAPAKKAWEQSLNEENGIYTLEISPNRGAESFQPINTNGSQRGWRPFISFLPQRLRDIEIIEGQDLKPLIADDFLLPNPRQCDPSRQYLVRFKATPVEGDRRQESQLRGD